MRLEVNRLTIRECLDKLKSGEWQVPKFQREFIWNKNQVFELLLSVFVPRPIGMLTLWVQPQNAPHCPAEPIRLNNNIFKHFNDNPAVMKFVLDGRQRLTTLAIAFGGLKDPDDRYTFSGRWFLNLDANEQDNSPLIVYKKQRETKDVLDSKPACLSRALIPLDEYGNLDFYNQNIHNEEMYPEGTFPSKDIRTQRAERLAKHITTFMDFQVAVAEIPSTITLPEVCDIFDVLNTTGTKVSTFDLIHNFLFSETAGQVELRQIFSNCQDEQESFGLLCEERRPEFFCQAVTACFMSEASPIGRNNSRVSTVKGGDLLNTPLDFYSDFLRNISRIDSYCNDLFRESLGGRFRLRDIPYPVSILLYITLRWRSDRQPETYSYSTDQLNRVFRAFFWRNSLAGRYDQGFLSLFGTDVNNIANSLEKNSKLPEAEWAQMLDGALSETLGNDYGKRDFDDTFKIVTESDVRGALQQSLSLAFHSRMSIDMLDGTSIDRFSNAKNKTVQLHHIFPKQWCKDNSGKHKVLQEATRINSFANLVPMTSGSNNKWKSKSPSTAIQHFELDFDKLKTRFEQLFIDREAFDALKADDPETFWKHRGSLIAQHVTYRQEI